MATDDIHTRSFCPKCDKEVQLSPDIRVRKLVEGVRKCAEEVNAFGNDHPLPAIVDKLLDLLAAFKGEKKGGTNG